MRKNKKKKTLPYFNIGEENVAYVAHLGKRVGARLFDFFLISIPIVLMTTFWGYSESLDFDNLPLVFPFWQPYFLTITITSICLTLLNFFILPIFFFKGQTLGKKFLNINVLVLDEKKIWQAVLIRELPLAWIALTSSLLPLGVGFDIGFGYSQYMRYYQDSSNSAQWISMFTWVQRYFSAQDVGITKHNFAMTTQVFSVMGTSFNLLLVITIALASNKCGAHDMIAKTAIIDLGRIYSKDDIEKARIEQEEYEEKESKIEPILVEKETKTKHDSKDDEKN